MVNCHFRALKKLFLQTGAEGGAWQFGLGIRKIFDGETPSCPIVKSSGSEEAILRIDARS